jgi:YjjG family noncanonical pyrimidine nucleotidase
MKYKNLFFDLDHTLWDFERNSSESLEEIFSRFSLSTLGIPSFEPFVHTFLRINTALWDSFDRGLIHHTYIRENRFRMVFLELGVACPSCHLEIGESYLEALPTKRHLLDGAVNLLQHVTDRGYQVHIITNGFDEIQAKKIASSGITHFFDQVITFERANAKKPDRRIFEYALEITNAILEESLMIGDNWIADILGAKQVGLDTAYYNPSGLSFDEKPTYDIRKLEELKTIL